MLTTIYKSCNIRSTVAAFGRKLPLNVFCLFQNGFSDFAAKR